MPGASSTSDRTSRLTEIVAGAGVFRSVNLVSDG
jgi:hypothetical protein